MKRNRVRNEGVHYTTSSGISFGRPRGMEAPGVDAYAFAPNGADRWKILPLTIEDAIPEVRWSEETARAYLAVCILSMPKRHRFSLIHEKEIGLKGSGKWRIVTEEYFGGEN